MKAETNYPVHDLIAQRWSPYAYSDKAVSDDDLRSLFEAARWAPSCYNEQPWGFIVARSEDGELFAKVLSCLVEANQVWAKHTPVLALGMASTKFARNDRPNRHAFHDLGLAAANLCIEATARGLVVHQMAGIEPAKAKQLFNVPDSWEVVTGIAIGYLAENGSISDEIKQRDAARRGRKEIGEFVFGPAFGTTATFLS